MHMYMYGYIYIYESVYTCMHIYLHKHNIIYKLATGGRHSSPLFVSLYFWYVPYNAVRYQVTFFSLLYDLTWDWTPVS